MLRALLAVYLAGLLASSLFAAEPARFAAPLNVQTEAGKIQAEFYKAMSQARRDQAESAKAVAARNEALGHLAAAAEAAHSTEHLDLAQVYLLLNRFDDAAREARAAIQVSSSDFAAHTALISALSSSQHLDEAVVAIRALLALVVADADLAKYLGACDRAVSLPVILLSNDDKFVPAEQVLSEWEMKLDKLKTPSESVERALVRSKKAVASLRDRVASAQKRFELVGQPYFPVEDATWLNGSPLKPEELRGKVVLLDFWAVWCGPCIGTFPHLRQWHEKYADSGLVIVGVTRRYNFDWDAESQRPKNVSDLAPEKEDAATEAFVKHHELKHRIAVMSDNAFAKKYLVTGIPEVVVVDKQGVIRKIRLGGGEENAKALENAIRTALGLSAEATSAEASR